MQNREAGRQEQGSPPSSKGFWRGGTAPVRLLPFAGLVLVAAGAFDLARPPENQFSARGAAALIRAYQSTVSPLLARAGVRCRFQPTCSEYALTTIRGQGLAAGGLRSLGRLTRCGPWTPPGTVDPPTTNAVAPAAVRAVDDSPTDRLTAIASAPGGPWLAAAKGPPQ